MPGQASRPARPSKQPRPEPRKPADNASTVHGGDAVTHRKIFRASMAFDPITFKLLSMHFRAGSPQYASVTFDQQLFGDQDAGLITLRVDGKAVALDVKRDDRGFTVNLEGNQPARSWRHIGREINISNQ